MLEITYYQFTNCYFFKGESMGKIKNRRREESVNQDIFLSRFTQNQQSNAQRREQIGPQTESQANGVSAHPDGTITVQGVKIGPFVGEWQGVMRNEIIAERLAGLTEADKKNTQIQLQGDGVRVTLGNVHFMISSAAAAGMSVEQVQGMTQTQAAALHILGRLGAEPPAKSMSEQRGELALKQAKKTYLEGREVVGNGSWETRGSNSGPLLDEINQANHAGSGYEWCGMYVGHAYKNRIAAFD